MVAGASPFSDPMAPAFSPLGTMEIGYRLTRFSLIAALGWLVCGSRA